MVSYFEANLKSVSVHHVGNKINEEYYKLSDKPLNIADDTFRSILMQYFLYPFVKTNEVFRFYHPADIGLNDVYNTVRAMFNEELSHDGSEMLAMHLFDCSTHPKIKSGELYIASFENVQIEGELHNAIGIFKSENKETFLKVRPEGDGFGMSFETDGISINKLDKGCLIFDTDKEEGFKVVVFDQSKSSSDVAGYWKDEFLQLMVRNDDYNQTSNIINVCKSFIVDKLDEEYDISKTDKIDLLNRSAKYFKEKETFDMDEFTNEVIANEEAIELFKNYKVSHEEEFDTTIADNFEISTAAAKQSLKNFKNVIKLDKNFQINVSGSKELIEKGYDEEKQMNFYKIYFREEA
jgi:hypothetical protein